MEIGTILMLLFIIVFIFAPAIYLVKLNVSHDTSDAAGASNDKE